MVTKTDATPAAAGQLPCDAFEELLAHCTSMLEAAVARSETRFVIRLMRHYKTLRSFLNNHTASSIPVIKRHVSAYASGANPCSIAEFAYKSFPSEEELPKPAEGQFTKRIQYTVAPMLGMQEYISRDSRLPETKVMLLTLALIYFIDSKDYTTAMELGNKLAHFVLGYNKRVMDYLGAKVYFYYSRAYELGGRFAETRALLMDAYRKACLHHDPMTQAVTFNCILRNLLYHRLYSFAFKLICKTSFPDYLSSNAQYARYLFYYGKVLAVQLEYSEAHNKLMQALRKAPQNDKAAYGFKLAATKMSVIVGLLMGDIPVKSIFTNPIMRKDLIPYESVVIAVRNGDLSEFANMCDKYSKQFERDETMFLISRLRHNVIKGGLRKINLAYSKLQLANVASKLGIKSVEDTESIIAKAIHDGIMEAIIDHDGQYVQSKINADLYKSDEPMKAFHKRINFCLKLHSNAIKAVRYPDEPDTAKDPKQSPTTIDEEKIVAMADDDGVDGGSIL